MPLIKESSYKPALGLGNMHIQTIFPFLFRNIKGVSYQRERILTPDKDFLDIDWSFSSLREPSAKKVTDSLVIISHGMEGNTYRPYVLGMVKYLNHSGFDTLSWNFRSCSGEMNNMSKSYHSGATEDIETVIQHCLRKRKYKNIFLVGFSVGGNIALKYLGEKGDRIANEIKKAVTFSVPCNLEATAYKMSSLKNTIYLNHFLKRLYTKICLKSKMYPNQIKLVPFKEINSFKDFDDLYTAPLNGFKDAIDYWNKASSKNYLKNISIPTLLINAQNDTFLSPESFPISEARDHKFLYLEMPEKGGHNGFISLHKSAFYWSEIRTLLFFKDV